MDWTSWGYTIRGKAEVVFDITNKDITTLMLSFEFLKQFLRGFTQNIDEYVQATAMRHTDHCFSNTFFGSLLDQCIE